MLFMQLVRCILGLIEAALWLFFLAVALLGFFLLNAGFTGTGLSMMLGAAWFVACALRRGD